MRMPALEVASPAALFVELQRRPECRRGVAVPRYARVVSPLDDSAAQVSSSLWVVGRHVKTIRRLTRVGDAGDAVRSEDRDV